MKDDKIPRVHWLELDKWARETGRCFYGTADELMPHLLEVCNEPKATVDCVVKDLTLIRVDDYVSESLRTTVVTLKTPWGDYRWIPQPKPRLTKDALRYRMARGLQL
jgi:hypothetical protein